MPWATKCRSWKTGARGVEEETFYDLRPDVSFSWLSMMHTLPETFQQRTLTEIRELLRNDRLREHRSIGSITLGWGNQDTILRLITRDRQLIHLAIGDRADFAMCVLCPNVDSRSSRDWKNFKEMEEAFAYFRDRGWTIRLPERITPEAAKIHLIS